MESVARCMEPADRRSFLGGTDVAAILGLSRFRTPYDVWMEKTGRSTGPRETARMEWGKRLEPAVAQAFSDRTGLPISKGAFAMHRDHPFLGASPDYLIEGERPGVLECKTSGGVLMWPPDMAYSGIDPGYEAQVRWYAGITGRTDQLWVAVLINGCDFRIYPVSWDGEFYLAMVEAAIRFWKDHVEADVPPEGAREEAPIVRSAREDGIWDGADGDAELLAEYAKLKATEAEVAERIRAVRGRIVERVGGARGIRAGGFVALVSGGRETVDYDWKAVCLELNAPKEVVERHKRLKQTPVSVRVMEES
ncbi:MAG: YqaJ viral recombinase family protein [Fimbriimonadales bacterium]